MPRVLLNKQFKMPQYFTEWIVIQMRRNNENQATLGRVLNITQQAFSTKMKNNQYTLQDFITITNHFKATDEDLVKLTKV